MQGAGNNLKSKNSAGYRTHGSYVHQRFSCPENECRSGCRTGRFFTDLFYLLVLVSRTKTGKTICIYVPIGYYEIYRVMQQEQQNVKRKNLCVH